MRKYTRTLPLIGLILFFLPVLCLAKPVKAKEVNNVVEQRALKEDKILPDSFAVNLYKPTYILPYYYTGSPDYAVYQNNTPGNEKIKKSEVKYQISIKVPLWKNILNYPSSLFFAYTQLSYWQLYDKNTFFRETNYEPELFVATHINYPLFKDWKVDFLNIGLAHQSNGVGNSHERSWNRLYLEAIASSGNWMVSLKPWYVLSTNGHNSNITSYLGYGRVLVAYKFHKQVFSLQAHNLIEGGARRATAELTWSFPLLPYIKGYVEAFSGYGQSLIEYNHRTNSVGVGVALNDWV